MPAGIDLAPGSGRDARCGKHQAAVKERLTHPVTIWMKRVTAASLLPRRFRHMSWSSGSCRGGPEAAAPRWLRMAAMTFHVVTVWGPRTYLKLSL